MGVNIMTSMEKLGEELFSERETVVLVVGKQFFVYIQDKSFG